MARRRITARIAAALVSVTLAGCADDDGAEPASTTVEPTAAPASTPAVTAGTTSARPTPTTGASAEPTATTTAPTLTPAPCDAQPADPARVSCGLVDVPERHARPDGTRLQIAVAVVAPVDATTAGTPLFVLAGGPGYGSLDELDDQTFLAAFGDRPVVLVDYRGVGASQPSLACPEVDELAVPSLAVDSTDPATVARSLDAIARCRDRLLTAGIDLGAYDYTEIAADLADVRAALGYDAWSLYGISNGGRVALEVARRHPEGLQAMVLDAALPPQGSLPGELWPHAQRSFDVLFDGCAADPACHAAVPDLRATFTDLVARIGAAPVDVTIAAGDGSVPVTVRFSADLVITSLRAALYDTALIPLLPSFLAELAAGRRYEEVAGLVVDRTVPRRFSQGMQLSVDCQEEVAFLPSDLFERQAQALPLLAPAILADGTFAACAVWDVGRADPSIEEPVVSDIPTLLLVGEYDPVHPRSSSEQIAAGLSHATLVELPGMGHGTVGVHPCPSSLVAPFLDDPGSPVDTTCVAAMAAPAWVVP